MADHKARISELAGIMDEFGLSEASLTSGELSISFKKRGAAAPVQPVGEAPPLVHEEEHHEIDEPVVQPQGTPVSSPMTGIFYAAPSPGSPPFVKEGDTVTAGQVIGLIEAMKVFNEIPSPLSGTVLKLGAASGDLIQPGDPILFIG